MDRVGRAAAAAIPFVSLWSLLGTQGARLGSVELHPISTGWILVALGLAFWATPPRPAAAPGRPVMAGALFLLSLVLLTAWRSHALRSGDSVQIEGRNELRRITGKRRDVSLEKQGTLEVPKAGTYVFALYCDDSCEIAIGDEVIRAEGAARRALDLPRGDVSFGIRYRQNAGPARLAISWDRPALFEPLPIDHFARLPGMPGPRRVSAHLAFGGLVLWWAVFPLYWVRLARSKSALRASTSVPRAVAAAIALYGSLLRFEAFLAHSGLTERSEIACRVHAALLPWLPRYGVFNPESAPDDPYRADVRSYLDRAETMAEEGFYAPSFREPFYVLLVRVFVGLAGGAIGILIESALFSALALVLFYVLAERLRGGWWAVALLVPVALHEWLVLDAPTGYRESAYSFFLLAFLAAIPFRSGVASGILGALLCLIRLSALSIVAPLAAIRVFRLGPGKRTRYAATFALALLLLLGPFLYSNFRAKGDPFYSVSFHTEFWLRAEGLHRDSGPVGLWRYFTDFKRGGALALGTVKGLSVLPLRTFWNGFRAFPLLGAVAIALGVLGILRASNLYLTAAYFGHLVAFAYIQNFPSGEMPRFVMPAFYVLVLSAGERMRKRARRPPGPGNEGREAIGSGRAPERPEGRSSASAECCARRLPLTIRHYAMRSVRKPDSTEL